MKIIFCVLAIGLVYFMAKSKRNVENFSTNLSFDPSLSYKAHEYAFEKICELKGLKAVKFPIPGQPGSYETKCTIPDFETCEAMNKTSEGSGLSYKWTRAKVPKVVQITSSTSKDKVDKEVKRLLEESVAVVQRETKNKQAAVLQRCYTEKSPNEIPTDQTITECKNNPEVANEIDRLSRESFIETGKIMYKWASKQAINEDLQAYSLLGIDDNTSYALPIPTSYVEGEDEQDLCVRIPNWMENFCKGSNPCIGGTWKEKDASCSRESGMIRFSIGNLRCYPESGYCEPKDFSDAFVGNCVMTQEYCKKLDTDYDPIETVYECDGTKCTKQVPRGRCRISDVQFFLENALPMGTTMLRKWKAAGEALEKECAANPGSKECWNSVGLVLASPGQMVFDTGKKWFAENFDDISRSWTAAMNDPSPHNVGVFLSSFEKMPKAYMMGKMGEMLDAIINMIPGLGKIWPDGLLKTMGSRYFSGLWTFYQIRYVTIYAMQYGPLLAAKVVDKFSSSGAQAVNFLESQTPYVLSQIGSGVESGVDWTKGALSTAGQYLEAGAGYVQDLFTGKLF